MAYCVQSIDNRFFTELEPEFGAVPAISSANQFSALRLGVRQTVERPQRRDKTGTRTFAGVAPGGRRHTTFDVEVYHTENLTNDPRPRIGPLIESSMGAAAAVTGGQGLSGSSTAEVLHFNASHNLVAGHAVTVGDEVRFVKQVLSSTSVAVCSPFSTSPSSASQTGDSATYRLASDLPSISLFDYWDPAGAVSRIVHGAVCDSMTFRVNSDFHMLEFSGQAKGLLDSETHEAGDGGLASFPEAPPSASQLGQPIPGNLGQAWLGDPINRFFTVVDASVTVVNNIRARSNEFGTSVPQCIIPGQREVILDLEILESDDAATKTLYSSAVHELGIPVMIQAGSQAGQLAGLYLPAVVPDVPEFDDSDRLLAWRFRSARATGTQDDELQVAFG